MSAAALTGVGLVIFVLAWFQPQKLFLNKTVNEPLPGLIQTAPAGQADHSATAGGSPPPGLQVFRSGRFRSLEHATTGTAIVLRLTDGRLFLRLERLSTSNGPDVRVYLSHVPAGGDRHAYRTGFIDLGALKGNRGSQNYAIPAGTDLSAFKSAVIWCRRFAVGFAVAPLSP
jgi:Electron transfer DM13